MIFKTSNFKWSKESNKPMPKNESWSLQDLQKKSLQMMSKHSSWCRRAPCWSMIWNLPTTIETKIQWAFSKSRINNSIQIGRLLIWIKVFILTRTCHSIQSKANAHSKMDLQLTNRVSLLNSSKTLKIAILKPEFRQINRVLYKKCHIRLSPKTTKLSKLIRKINSSLNPRRDYTCLRIHRDKYQNRIIKTTTSKCSNSATYYQERAMISKIRTSIRYLRSGFKRR